MIGESRIKTIVWAVSILAIAISLFYSFGNRIGSAANPFGPYISIRPIETPKVSILRSDSSIAGLSDYVKVVNEYSKANYRAAETYFQTAVSVSPNKGDWWLILGVSQALLRKPDLALTSLQSAEQLSEEPAKSSAKWFESQCYLMQGNLAEAVKLLDGLAANGKVYSTESRELLHKLKNDFDPSAH